jgi:hypothetical protein
MDMACFFHLTMSALQGNEHSKLLALEREVALDQGLAKGRVLEVAVEVALDSAVEVAVATVLYGRARGYPLTLVGSYCPGWRNGRLIGRNASTLAPMMETVAPLG